MRTQRIARLDLAREQLGTDLELLPRLELSTAYSDYICGGPWLSCMLWSVGSATGDGFLTHYGKSTAASWTPQAEHLPAVRRLIERNFGLSKLNFARLAILQPGSVIIPHRDLLELEAPLHRLHVPLVTDEDCMFTEKNVVYRMRAGEVWFLDASSVHSAACFSDRDRVHLILDFCDDASAGEMVSVPHSLNGGIDVDCIVERPSLTPAERSALNALSAVLDERNHHRIIELVIQQHYYHDGGEDFIWSMLLDIAARASNRLAADRLSELFRYFMLERSAEPITH